MSLESDARDCLIEAIADRHGRRLSPADFRRMTAIEVNGPDPDSWLVTLRAAADRLRESSQGTRDIKPPHARAVLPETLMRSQMLLIERAGGRVGRQIALGAGATLLVAAAIGGFEYWRRRRAAK